MIYLTAEQYDTLTAVAYETNQSKSEFMKWLLVDYLDRHSADTTAIQPPPTADETARENADTTAS